MRRCTVATIAAASDSTSAGCSGAIASTSWGRSSDARRAVDPGPRHPVVRDEVDVITGPGCQGRQQQCGVHRPVQARPAARVPRRGVDADAARGGPAGVQHDDHPTVPLRPPGADHDVGPPRGGAPVDGPDVVADDVFAQRVEFGALAADQHRDRAVELAELRQPRRQVLAREERRKDPHLRRHPVRALPARQAQRTDGPRRDQRRLLVAAADRPQRRVDPKSLSTSDLHDGACAAPRAPTAPTRRESSREARGGRGSRRSAPRRRVRPSRAAPSPSLVKRSRRVLAASAASTTIAASQQERAGPRRSPRARVKRRSAERRSGRPVRPGR